MRTGGQAKQRAGGAAACLQVAVARVSAAGESRLRRRCLGLHLLGRERAAQRRGADKRGVTRSESGWRGRADTADTVGSGGSALLPRLLSFQLLEQSPLVCRAACLHRLQLRL